MTLAVQLHNEIQVTFNRGGRNIITQETKDLERPTSHVYVATANVNAPTRAIRAATRSAQGAEV